MDAGERFDDFVVHRSGVWVGDLGHGWFACLREGSTQCRPSRPFAHRCYPSAMPREMPTKTITVPANLLRACEQFNAGLYFDSHETLEEIWQEEVGDVRDLYKGLIQVAAALVHVTRGNFIGANRLFRTGVGYLAPYRQAGAMGFDIGRICLDAEAAHARLVADGPETVRFSLESAPRWSWDGSRVVEEARRWRAWGFDRAGNALEMEIPDLGE